MAAVPISAQPAAKQLVEHEGKTYDTVREGRAYILIPPNTRTLVDPQAKAKAGDGSEKPQNVFYNPIQQFNRDLSVLAIKAFGEDLCEKRSLKYKGGKNQAKKERKRQRKEAHAVAGQHEGDRGTKRKRPVEQDDGRDEDGEGVKLRKTDTGLTALPVEQTASIGAEEPEAQDTAQQATTVGGTIDGDMASSQADGGHTQGGAVMAEVPVAEDGVLDQKMFDVDKTVAAVNGDHAQQPSKAKFRILDALSATGLRALRYATEIPFATSITANDMDRNATKSIRTNVEHNKLGHVISVNTANAMAHMYSAAFPPDNSHGPSHVNGKYDVIDLDPYGTAAPFIDSALQALNDGGLLCVTCTDSGVFASCGYSEKTFSLYGGLPVKGPHSHEGGLRIILHSIASSAAKYGLAIEPLLSLSIDFYVRMFIRVSRSPADVKFLAGKTMLVYDCDAGCGAWNTQLLGRNVRQTGKKDVKGQQNNPTFNFKHSIAQGPSVDRLCEHCHSKMHVAGPMWGGPIHNAAFVGKVLDDARAADSDVYQTKPRIEGMLDTALDELVVIEDAEDLWRNIKREDGTYGPLPKTPPETMDLHPFFFMPSALSKVIHCVAPPEAAMKGALRHAGYRATRSHCKPGSIKTDAPWTVVWEVMREWVRQRQPIKEGALKEGFAGWHIMQAARKPEEVPNGTANGEDTKQDDSPDIVTETAAAPTGMPPSDPARIRVVFDEVLGKDKPGKRLVRYQQNPRENWGPMARAKGSA
ncbi:hypothetical protein LTR85_011903 [Meristemomyces frigidus]|nr:hypothetical protein LTR85_011903 [Meristemomyces frigidus]